MKKILFLLLFIYTASFAQTKHSCCITSSTEKFAMLASGDAFASAHPDPLPLNYTPTSGTMVKFKTATGKDANGFLIKSKKATDNWIIMVHEWWGLNDYIRQEAEKLQSEFSNSNVLAIDLYDGKVAATKAEAQTYVGELKQDRATDIIRGAIKYVGSKSQIFTIGWCMGGAWSLQASIMAGKQGAGCVMYYGMPETDLKKLSNLNADVLGIFAKKDEWINQEIVEQFEKDMKASGKKLIVESFDADHAFANPSNPSYDKAARDAAQKLVLAFFKERIH